VAKDAKQRLIDGLNKDLQGEFQAIIMYRLYASIVQGPYRQELRTFFANEIPEELLHAQVLADKIAALGGIPAATPATSSGARKPKQRGSTGWQPIWTRSSRMNRSTGTSSARCSHAGHRPGSGG